MATPTDPATLPNNCRYYWEAKGFTGQGYRVRVLDTQQATVPTDEVQADASLLEWQKGESDGWEERSIIATSVDLRLQDPAVDLSDLFGAEDDRYRVEIRDSAEQLLFKGYLVPDLFDVERYEDRPVTRLTAIDGLGLLKDRSLDLSQVPSTSYSASGLPVEGDYYHPIDVIKAVLPVGLPIQASLEWEARISADSNVNTGTDYIQTQILEEHVVIAAAAFETGDSQWDYLQRLLRTFGLQLQQTVYDHADYATSSAGRGALWHIMPRLQLARTSNNRFYGYDMGAGLPAFAAAEGDATTSILDSDQDSVSFRPNARSTFDRRVESVAVSWGYEDVEQVLVNGSFERDLSGWDDLTGSYTAINVTTGNRDTLNSTVLDTSAVKTGEPTQDNTNAFVGWIEADDPNADPADTPGIKDLISQELEVFGDAVTDYELSFAGAATARPFSSAFALDIRATAGPTDYHLLQTYVESAEDRLAGEDFVLQLSSALSGPIAEGTELPIKPDNQAVVQRVELLERAETGDTTIRIKADEPISIGQPIYYHYWDSVAPSFDVDPRLNTAHTPMMYEQSGTAEDYRDWGPIRYTNEAADGTIIRNVEMVISITRVDRENAPVYLVLNDLELDLVASIDSKTAVTSIVEAGDTIEVDALSGIPPTYDSTANNIAFVGDVSGIYTLFQLGAVRDRAGAWMDITALSALQLQRQLTEHAERLTLNVQRRRGEAMLWGHERVLFDGRVWEIGRMRTDVSEGSQTLDLVEMQLADAGVVDVAVYVDRGASTGGSGGRSFGTGGGSTGGPKNVTWGDVADKPNLVNSFEGRDGAVTLTSVDVETALGYTPFNAADYTPIQDVEAEPTLDLTGKVDVADTLSVSRGSITPFDFLPPNDSATRPGRIAVLADGFTGDPRMQFEHKGTTLLQLRGQADEATVQGALKVTAATDLQGLTVQQDATIQGNLTVLGTRFTADVQTVEISDNLAVINSGETGSGVTAGFAGWQVDRGTATNFRFGFDEGRDRFTVGQDGDTQVVATREDAPIDGGLGFYNTATNRFETTNAVTWDGSILNVDGYMRTTNAEVENNLSLTRDSITPLDFAPPDDSQTTANGRAGRIQVLADGYATPRLEISHHNNTLLQLRGGTNLVTVNSELNVAENILIDEPDFRFMRVKRDADSVEMTARDIIARDGGTIVNRIRLNDSDHVGFDGNIDVQGLIEIPSAHTGTPTQIRAGDTTTAGISVRARANPSNNQSLFAVESSGGATRFGVTQGYGGFFRDALRVGYAHDNGELPDPSHTLSVDGSALIEGQVTGGSYTSGIFGSGYIIDPNATGGSFAEFDNMRIRNEFRAHIFKKDVVKASNGYLLITDSAEVTETRTGANAISGPTDTIKIDTSAGNSSFSVGDLLWLKSISDDGATISGVKVEVTGTSSSGDETTLNVNVHSGGDINEGDTIVRVSGGYLMNDASTQNAPFLAVYDGVNSWSDFQSASKEKVRLGNLEGAAQLPSGTQPSGYGLRAENVFLSGHIEAGSGDIGGVSIESNTLTAGNLGAGVFRLAADSSAITNGSFVGTPSGLPTLSFQKGNSSSERVFVHMGETYSDGWTGRFGFSLTPEKNADAIFEVSRAGGGGLTAQIAGWDFDDQAISRTVGGTEISLGTSAGLSWSSSAVGLQAGTSPSDRVYMGGTSAGAVMGVDAGGNDLVRFGTSNYIQGPSGEFKLDFDNGTFDLQSGTIGGSVQIGGRSASDVSDNAVSSTDNLLTAKDASLSVNKPYTSTGWGYLGDIIDLQALGVEPGDTLSFSFEMKASGDYGWKMGGVWRDSNGSPIDTEYGITGKSGGNGDQWTRYTDDVDVPNNATQFELRFNADNFATSGRVLVRRPKINVGPVATPWTPSYTSDAASGSTLIDGGFISTNSIVADSINVDELSALNATIGGFNISDGAISTTVRGTEIALGGTDKGVSWNTAVRGLQIGKDSSNRMWFGVLGNGDYDFVVLENNNYKVRLGSNQNFIDGDLLINGSVTANEIAANTITADRVDVADLFAQDVDIEGKLTMGTDGSISNTNDDFTISAEGIELTAGSLGNTATRINWFDGITEVAFVAGYTDSNGGKLFMSGSDQIEYESPTHEFRDSGDGPFASLEYVTAFTNPTQGALLRFQKTFNGVPTDGQVRDWLDIGEAAIGAIKYNNGNINLLWMEHRDNGDVAMDTAF